MSENKPQKKRGRPKGHGVKGRTRPVSPLQRRFILAYPQCKTVREAVLKAGYSEKSANSAGYRLMRDPRILQRLDVNAAKRRQYREATQENIMEELSRLGFANILDHLDEDGNQIPLKDLPRDVAAAVKRLKVLRSADEDGNPIEHVDLELHDKKAALETMGKKHGMWTDNVEHKGAIGLAFIESLRPSTGPTGVTIEHDEAD